MVDIEVSLDGGETIVPNFDWQDLNSNSDFDPYSSSTSPGAIILVVLSFWALAISVPGLTWHIRNRNLPAASMVGWIVYLNLINIINALLWPNDNINSWWNGQVYCDLVIKLSIAGGMGLVGSLACIMRALAQALDTNNIRLMPSKSQRIRQLVLENFLCVILPLALALLHFAIQPLRFYIFAIAGCEASYNNRWYTVLLSFIWPPVICVVNGYYAILLIIRIYRYRRDFSSILASSTSGMNKSRFLRLFVSALTVLLVAIPTQAYALYVNAVNIQNDSWTPASWQTIVYVPTYGTVFPDCWIHVGIAVPVFLCFGWGKDANSVYRSWLRLLGFTKVFPALAAKTDNSSLLPSPVTNKR
ncbi:MAG: hypothetical protein GOMPHAMPRED_003858 [Gomphillus americanus]|uniref:Pheromone receptor n=1 Tax=Gomphillus americanus TaxID=1940652 RepID=A0A8H3FM29_9LECA|nr:MAG: hypothetical protein GOMPHAMPRED_003858 [Gomphillus americanus]